MQEKKVSYGKIIFGGILLLIIGVFVAILPILDKENLTNETLNKVVMGIGIVLAVLGFLLILAGLMDRSKSKKEKAAAAKEEAEQDSASPQAAQQSFTSYDVKPHKAETVQPKKDKHGKKSKVEQPEEIVDAEIKYIPSMEDYKMVQMGSRQSVEEKFNEIAKMDKTQFVIYVARLFSLKGYQVKFTPVVDNFGIDLIAEKIGVASAVACILTTRVLCETDIDDVLEGTQRYSAGHTMVVSNMYFDRSAVDYAKKKNITLIDRNILAEEFMK